jgi:chromate transporter
MTRRFRLKAGLRTPFLRDMSEEIQSTQPSTVSFGEAFRYWLKLGFINFGGPTGQIALMHADLVERKRWISEERFLHALNYCMLLPGPEAQQLAIYIGWLLHRTWGGIIAGAFFVIPSIFVLLTLSWLYAAHGQVPAVAGVLYGFKPVVLAIVAHATYRIASRAIKNEVLLGLAATAFVAIYFFKVPFPLIVLLAGLLGFLGSRLWPKKFAAGNNQRERGGAVEPSPVISDQAPLPQHTRPSKARAVKILAVGLTLWIVPFLILLLWRGGPDVLAQEYLFFTKAALVTFGGAYAVLAYIAQVTVFHYHWLAPGHMIDGLALAETTPGPLIMVVQFVGFMGGWNSHGEFSPALAGTIGALLTTYVTFLPSFLFIFLGAPHIEELRGNVKLTAALSGITAAVVGVVLNLAVFFGAKVLFPDGGFDWFAAAVAAVALYGLWRYKWEIIWVVLAGGAMGLVKTLLLPALRS